MSLTAAEIDSIFRSNEISPSDESAPARELRELLTRLPSYGTEARPGRALAQLSRAGVEHAWRVLEAETESQLLANVLPKARASLRRYLQRTLEKITRPSFELEWTSFSLASRSLGLTPSANRAETERTYLRKGTAHRLASLFKKFPVLPRLWVMAIRQWRLEVVEILVRIRKDHSALRRLLSDADAGEKIEDLRLGLSDPHRGGRSVALVEFSGKRRAIYKPRSGRNELAWSTFLGRMNRQGFHPKLRTMRLLVRKGYCWMEYAEPAPCPDTAAVRRFYKRLGGLIAAAYLLKAVDCHRENLIAAGEHPILVDVDALWHVAPLTRTQSRRDVLYRTGFFPNARRRSLQSRSSVLGPALSGAHLPRLGHRPVAAARYANEIVSGFSKAWRCIMGDARRRAAFRGMLRKMRSRERRWIYCATAQYAAVLRASLGPAVLRSKADRDALIRRFSMRSEVSHAVARAEIKALSELNIPYFNRSTEEQMPREPGAPPPELVDAIQDALPWAEHSKRRQFPA